MTTAEQLGWGPPGCEQSQLSRVTVPGMLDSGGYFPLYVRREVAPLFQELLRWLVAERAALHLPALSCSGGYNKRKIRGSATAWSNHSWALAGDFCVATNPMQLLLRTDMPHGTAEKAASLGFVWGGSYRGRKDPMHFEFVGTPADALARAARLSTAPPAAQKDPLLKYTVAGALKGSQAALNIQTALVKHGSSVKVTGRFDKSTANAVTSFQRRKGLTVTGTTTQETWDALRKPATA